jgi:hypothetical protein
MNRNDGGNRTGQGGVRLKAAVLSLLHVLLLLSPIADVRQAHAAAGNGAAATEAAHGAALHAAVPFEAGEPACALCALLGAPLRYDVAAAPITACPATPVALPRDHGALPRTSAPLLAPGSRAPPLA